MEKTWIEKAAEIVPSPRQVAWNCMEFYGFVHFGLYTFDREHEFATGPEIFNPVNFDARQWVKAYKAAGMTGLLLTCKHHEGFCLWPSKYTEFSVKNSPWKDGKGDIVKEVSEACREEGLKFGVYLSPWDVHEETYGTPAYNDYFCNQMTELCSNYGELFCVWFDGACRTADKVQGYDWDRYYSLIRKLQPNACISICGPDVRWIGNEAGESREEEWSVVPKSIMVTERNPGYWRQLDTMPNSTWKDIGSRDFIKDYDELIWYPAEVDVSIRPSWGYVEGEEKQLYSLETLLYMYEKAVGGNATLLLNVPPNKEGLFDLEDVERLAELGKAIRGLFSRPQTTGAKAFQKNGSNAEAILDANRTHFVELAGECQEIEIQLQGEHTIDFIVLKETIEKGQRVEKFAVDIWREDQWKEIYQATTIGYQRFGRIEPVQTERVRVRILESRGTVYLTEIGLYHTEK